MSGAPGRAADNDYCLVLGRSPQSGVRFWQPSEAGIALQQSDVAERVSSPSHLEIPTIDELLASPSGGELFCDTFVGSLPSPATSSDAVSVGYASSQTSPTEEAYSQRFPPQVQQVATDVAYMETSGRLPSGKSWPNAAKGNGPRRSQGTVVLSASERRARNRLASAKYRQKKSKWEADLLVSHDKLKERCKQLEDLVEGLIRENEILRSELSPEALAKLKGIVVSDSGAISGLSPSTGSQRGMEGQAIELSQASSAASLNFLRLPRPSEQVLHLKHTN